MSEPRKIETSRTCKLCATGRKEEFDYDILNKMTIAKLAEKYEVSVSTVSRHKRYCHNRVASPIRNKKRPLTQMIERPEINPVITAVANQVDRIHAPLEKLKEDAEEIRRVATEGRQYGTALSAIEKIAKLIEVQVKLSAELRDQERHNEHIQKREWARTQEFIWKFMDEHKLTEEFWDGLAALGTTSSR